MSIILREPWTVERFLFWEDRQEGRHEFDGVRILEMTGGSRAHQRIVFNLTRLLIAALDPARFDVLAEMRITAGGKVRYPDVAVCLGPVPDGVRTLDAAVAIFEVLSPDTAEADRGEKRGDYARLPGIRHYVMVEQARRGATILDRAGAAWVERPPETGGRMDLPGLGIALDLTAVYQGTSVPA